MADIQENRKLVYLSAAGRSAWEILKSPGAAGPAKLHLALLWTFSLKICHKMSHNTTPDHILPKRLFELSNFTTSVSQDAGFEFRANRRRQHVSTIHHTSGRRAEDARLKALQLKCVAADGERCHAASQANCSSRKEAGKTNLCIYNH